MNAIGQTIFVLLVQVTLVVVVALIASRRRNPAMACGPLVLAVGCVLLLTPLAFLPRPTWERPMPTATPTPDSPTTTPSEPGAASSEIGLDVLQLLRSVRPQPVVNNTSTSPWVYVAWAALLFASIGVLRLFFAWWAVRHVVRRSQPIADDALSQAFTDLAHRMECSSVRLREVPTLNGAATVGWWRPIVLLGHDWRDWTVTQQQAVLAHELAHVRRRDYATRFLAQVVRALFGYHPLVRWLVRRLEVQQELAADAWAVPYVGRPRVYAQALAALALRTHAQPATLMPSFFTRPKTLLRRMAMLQFMEERFSKRGRRWPALVAVGLVAIGVLALHGRSPHALASPVVPVKFTETKRAPLDYTYLTTSANPNEVGCCVLRLGELKSMPGMEPFVDQYGESVKALLGDHKLPCEVKDIEQIGGRVNVGLDAGKPSPNRHLGISLTFVRTTKDVDWAKYLQGLCQDWKELKHAETTYYSGRVKLPIFPTDKPVHFYIPDARTLVLESEDVIKGFIDAKKKPASKPEWASHWVSSQEALAIMILPNPKNKLATMLASDKDEKDTEKVIVSTLGTIMSRSSHAVIAFDSGKETKLMLHFPCATAKDAEAVDQGCQKLAKISEESWAKSELGKPLPMKTMLRRGVDFGTTPTHNVHLEFAMQGRLADLLKVALGGK